MYQFKVQAVNCGGCVNTVTNALLSLDPKVKVSADVKSQPLSLESTHDQPELSSLIGEAGYAVEAASII